MTHWPSLAGNATMLLRGKPWQERRLHEEKHGCPSLGWLSDLCSLVNLVCLPETQDIEFKTDLQRKDMEDPPTPYLPKEWTQGQHRPPGLEWMGI